MMNIKDKKNKRKYNMYMNCRLGVKENKILKELMRILKTHNKSKIVRYLINNNNIIKK